MRMICFPSSSLILEKETCYFWEKEILYLLLPDFILPGGVIWELIIDYDKVAPRGYSGLGVFVKISY